MSGHKLYIALRLMNKGSAADVVRYGWPGGMEQDVVRCILAQALKGLKYVPRLIYMVFFLSSCPSVIFILMDSSTATSKLPTCSSTTMEPFSLEIWE